MDTKQQLLDNVMDIAKTLEKEDLCVSDFVDEALGIETIHFSPSGNFKGAEILLAFGGPTIWIETGECKIYGAWGGDNFERSYEDNSNLDEYMEELYGNMIESNR